MGHPYALHGAGRRLGGEQARNGECQAFLSLMADWFDSGVCPSASSGAFEWELSAAVRSVVVPEGPPGTTPSGSSWSEWPYL